MVKRFGVLLVLGVCAGASALAISSTSAPEKTPSESVTAALSSLARGAVSLTIDTGQQRTTLTRDSRGNTAMTIEAEQADAVLRAVEYRRVDGTLYARGFPTGPTSIQESWLNVSEYLAKHKSLPDEWSPAGGVFDLPSWVEKDSADAVFAHAIDPIDGFFGMSAAECLKAADIATENASFSIKCRDDLPPLLVRLSKEGRLSTVELQGTTAEYAYAANPLISAPQD